MENFIDISDVAYAMQVKRQTAVKYTQDTDRNNNVLKAEKKAGKTGGILVDLRDFVAWIKRRQASELGIGDDGNVYDYQAERARLTKNQADHESLKVRQLDGDLLPAEEVVELWSKKLLQIRAAILAMPIKVAQASIEHDDFRAAEIAGRHVVNELLNELSDELIEDTKSLEDGGADTQAAAAPDS